MAATPSDPRIETPRLILRLPAAEDFEAYARFSSDPESMRFLGGVKSRAEAWRAWCTLAGSWRIEGFSMFSLIERETGRWVGHAGPWRPADWPGGEVGWSLAREFTGKGLAQEAAAAALDFAFDDLGWSEVIHCIDPENARSIRLAERLGSTKRGPTRLPPPFQDARVDAYGQTREQWRARPRARDRPRR